MTRLSISLTYKYVSMVVRDIYDLQHRPMSALGRQEWQQWLGVQRLSFECHEPKETVTRLAVA